MNHFMGGFAEELIKVAVAKVVKDDNVPSRSMKITRRSRRKGQAESRPATAVAGGAFGSLIGGVLAARYGKSPVAVKAMIGAGGVLGMGAGYKSGKKGRAELLAEHVDHLGPAATLRFLQRAKAIQEKTAAFPQHEAKDAPYDTASSTAKTMETTQGMSSKKGLKGAPIQTAPGLSKKAPTPLTTPNFMVDG